MAATAQQMKWPAPDIMAPGKDNHQYKAPNQHTQVQITECNAPNQFTHEKITTNITHPINVHTNTANNTFTKSQIFHPHSVDE